MFIIKNYYLSACVLNRGIQSCIIGSKDLGCHGVGQRRALRSDGSQWRRGEGGGGGERPRNPVSLSALSVSQVQDQLQTPLTRLLFKNKEFKWFTQCERACKAHLCCFQSFSGKSAKNKMFM